MSIFKVYKRSIECRDKDEWIEIEDALDNLISNFDELTDEEREN